MTARTPQGPASVTERQREVASLIADGMTNPQIADTLGITLDGAKHHVSQLLIRLNLERREEIANWYRAEAHEQRLRLASLSLLLLVGAVSTASIVGAIVLGVAIVGRSSTPAVDAPVIVAPAAPTVDLAPGGVATPTADTFEVTVDDLHAMNLGTPGFSRYPPPVPPPLVTTVLEGDVDASSIESSRARAALDGLTAGVFTVTEALDDGDPEDPLARVSSRVVLYLSRTHALAEFFDLIAAGRQLVTDLEVIDPPGEPASGVWDDAVRISEYPGSSIVLVRVGPALGTIVVTRADGQSTVEESTSLARQLAEQMRDVLTDLGAFEE